MDWWAYVAFPLVVLVVTINRAAYRLQVEISARMNAQYRLLEEMRDELCGIHSKTDEITIWGVPPHSSAGAERTDCLEWWPGLPRDDKND